MVDDGSTDESVDLCRQVCKKDCRFILLSQPHRGVSAARNTGMQIACGRVISFVDCDDTIESNYALEICKALQGTDKHVVFFGYNRIMDHGTYVERRIPPDAGSTADDFYLLLSDRNMFGYTWLKAYKKEVVQDVWFDEGLSRFEDEVFTCDALKSGLSVTIIQKPIYNYNAEMPNSLSLRASENYCLLRDRIFLAWRSLFERNHYELSKLLQIAEECYRACEYHKLRYYPSEGLFLEDLHQCNFYHYMEAHENDGELVCGVF